MTYNTIKQVRVDFTYNDSGAANTNQYQVNFDGKLSGSVDVGDILFLHDVKLNFMERTMRGFTTTAGANANPGYLQRPKAFMSARLVEKGDSHEEEGRHFPKIGEMDIDLEIGDLSSVTYALGGDEDDQGKLNDSQRAINEVDFEGFRIKASNNMGCIYHAAGSEDSTRGNQQNWIETRNYEEQGLCIKLGEYGSVHFARLNGNSNANKKDVSIIKLGKALNDAQNQNDEGFNRHYPDFLKNMQIEFINEKAKDNSKREVIALTYAMNEESSVMVAQQENTTAAGVSTKGNLLGYNKQLNENQTLEARYSNKQFEAAGANTDSNQLRVGVVHKF